jgi:nucleotide-binding universal stress UspA family protein
MQETGLVSGMLRRSASVSENLILRNILLATDFSEFSTRALGYALGIASRLKARLHLFHCIDPRPYSFADPGEVETARNDARRELERLAADLGRQYRASNVELNVVVKAGNLPGILSRAIEDLGLDLIVIGTHGRSGWRKLALGSVAETIIRQAACPVLSVGPYSHRTRIQEFGPANIELAYESLHPSQLAQSYALSLARKYGARLTEVDVLDDHAGRVTANVSQSEWFEPEKKDSILETLPSGSLHRSTQTGSESDFVLDVAGQTSSDLIVLAVPSTHRFTDQFRSTNAYRVISDAECPVLTVHAGTERGAQA